MSSKPFSPRAGWLPRRAPRTVVVAEEPDWSVPVDTAVDARAMDRPTAPAIRVTDLVRRYRSGATVGPLSFEVPRAAITGLVGPNGVGKTTTIRMLLGLVAPNAGELQVLDATSWRDLPTVLPRVGALVDSPALVPTMTGRGNLLMLARLAGWSNVAVDASLELVGLTPSAERRVREYSLGMRQRLALAGALIGDPELLIVDEPANGLDPQGIAQLRLLLRRIAERGTSIVVSSHVLAEVEQVCDHLVVMNDRGVAFHGTRADLSERLRGSLRVGLEAPTDRERLCAVLRDRGYRAEIGQDAVITVRAAVDEPQTVPDGGAINALAIGEGLVLTLIEPRRQSLEDIFFELTGPPGSSADRLGDTLVSVPTPEGSLR